MKVTNDLSFTLLRKGLDALSARQTVVANNIANVETPNYKASDVVFEDTLRRAIVQDAPNLRLAKTDDDHLNRVGEREQRIEELHHRTFRRNDTSMRKDGNNVDIENEMIRMAETGLSYQTLSTLATKKLALMRMVIQETR